MELLVVVAMIVMTTKNSIIVNLLFLFGKLFRHSALRFINVLFIIYLFCLSSGRLLLIVVSSTHAKTCNPRFSE